MSLERLGFRPARGHLLYAARLQRDQAAVRRTQTRGSWDPLPWPRTVRSGARPSVRSGNPSCGTAGNTRRPGSGSRCATTSGPMKFLCVPCDSPMKLQAVSPPDRGSLSVVYACPERGYEMAMLTNAYETQLVQSLGVRIGPEDGRRRVHIQPSRDSAAKDIGRPPPLTGQDKG